jgi:peptidoglycan-N-acetylglucosamine deacetylase
MKRILSLLLIFILFIFVSGAICEEKMVALTFDDGPNPSFLVKALPFFQEENIKVTFFVVGSRAKEYPQWIKRAYEAGHEVENHSWSHICLARPSPRWSLCQEISLEKAIWEIKRTRELIEELIGYRTIFLRPPHFAMTEKRKLEIENALNMRVLRHGLNSIGSLDWACTEILRR